MLEQAPRSSQPAIIAIGGLGSLARLDGLIALGIHDKVQLHSISPLDFQSIAHVVERVGPREVYNFAGQSSVALSFSQPIDTFDGILFGTLNILEVLRRIGSTTRFYHAGSSECFGDTGAIAANEQTAFRPRSPYGIAKAAAISLVANYRDAYGLFACSGISFNHESPLRPARFVTRKITVAASRIADGSSERLSLGDLSVRQDWGWAPDYVQAMWAILQHDTPDDFVIATGISHTLKEFVAAAFDYVGLGWRDHVDFDDSLKRLSDIANQWATRQRRGESLGGTLRSNSPKSSGEWSARRAREQRKCLRRGKKTAAGRGGRRHTARWRTWRGDTIGRV